MVDGHPARELDDDILAEEIKLLGELVLAASGVRRHLTQDEVDQLLGLRSDRQREAAQDGVQPTAS